MTMIETCPRDNDGIKKGTCTHDNTLPLSLLSTAGHRWCHCLKKDFFVIIVKFLLSPANSKPLAKQVPPCFRLGPKRFVKFWENSLKQKNKNYSTDILDIFYVCVKWKKTYIIIHLMIISLSLPPALDHEPSPKTGSLPASNVCVKASILICCEQLYKWLIITLNSKSSLSADNEPQNSESTWWNFFLKISRHMVFIRMSLRDAP